MNKGIMVIDKIYIIYLFRNCVIVLKCNQIYYSISPVTFSQYMYQY